MTLDERAWAEPYYIQARRQLLSIGIMGHLRRWGGGEVRGVLANFETDPELILANQNLGYWTTAYKGTYTGPVPHEAVDLNLRHGDTRDRMLRLLGEKLWPGVECFAVPELHGWSDGRWSVTIRDAGAVTHEQFFAADEESAQSRGGVHVPGLASAKPSAGLSALRALLNGIVP
jgi:hypothetical protein